jgi:hypothetical protein
VVKDIEQLCYKYLSRVVIQHFEDKKDLFHQGERLAEYSHLVLTKLLNDAGGTLPQHLVDLLHFHAGHHEQ